MRPDLTLAALLVTLSCLSAGPAGAGNTSFAPGAGWQLERDVDAPTYAFLEPTVSDLDIDVMVLSCEKTERKDGLQLRLYPLEPGPLRPSHSPFVELAPDAVIEIDGKPHPARLMFADHFAVVADAADGPVPVLSASLVTALQTGRHFAMKIHPVEISPSSIVAPPFQITADLQAGIGGAAVAALRRCATPNGTLAAGATRGR